MQRKLFLLTFVLFIHAFSGIGRDISPAPSFRNILHQRPDNVRRTAIMLNASLGFFGVHRMYLGTSAKVPVFYTLSMGGGGLLWLVDLGILIKHKDVSAYLNNPHMFMWSDKKPASLPAIGQ
jgi:TM2 domain-containing membrane protein YozV